MKSLLISLLAFCLPVLGFAQTPVSAAVNSAGWKRVAFVNSASGRGFGKVSVYSTGSSSTPYHLDIEWFKDWSVTGGISISSNSTSGYWNEARLTYDGDSTFIEVNFTRDVGSMAIISDTYGWNSAQPFSGILPNGGGTVRALTKVGKLAIGENLMVAFNGNVGIGTLNPSSKLSVNGTVRAKEVRVEASPWPDYVFQDGYDLPSLTDVKNHIERYGHLPEVPSASTVEKEGIDLGKMNALLLKKIEELTLHLIEKEERINSLDERIKLLEKN
ncbi:hypothetical protein [Sphingobacterium endophyticum]|uniref:hypothetical protein n=1 Tax=Sphingobacterium endophyticum TaxID=2546448 RepID=UPI0012E2381F|nr:hypothetical protein [Sphingobacterium endophyticum]